MTQPEEKILFYTPKGNIASIAKLDIGTACKTGTLKGEEMWQISPVEELRDAGNFYRDRDPDQDIFVTICPATRAEFEGISPDFVALPIFGQMHYDTEEWEKVEEDPVNEDAFVRIFEIGEIYRPDGKEYKRTTVRMRGTLVDFETPLLPEEFLARVPTMCRYHVLEALARGDAAKSHVELKAEDLGPGPTQN